MFVNVAFIIDEMGESFYGIIIFLIALLIGSIAVLYTGIKHELMQFKCISKRFPQKIKSHKIRDTD